MVLDSLQDLVPARTPRLDSLEGDDLEKIVLGIYTEEGAYNRWMSVSFHDVNRHQSIQKPIVSTQHLKGVFEIRFSDFENVTTGPARMIQESGHFPMQYQISFPDSDGLLISGKTLPFQLLRQNYSFDSGEYSFEFIYSDTRSTGSLDPTESEPVASEVSKVTSQPKRSVQPNQTPIRANTLKRLFAESVWIASIGLVVILLLIFAVLFSKKRAKSISRQSFADILDEKAEQPESSVPRVRQNHAELTPEMREQRIRDLMAEGNLTYDEATLRLQYEPKEKANE